MKTFTLFFPNTVWLRVWLIRMTGRKSSEAEVEDLVDGRMPGHVARSVRRPIQNLIKVDPLLISFDAFIDESKMQLSNAREFPIEIEVARVRIDVLDNAVQRARSLHNRIVQTFNDVNTALFRTLEYSTRVMQIMRRSTVLTDSQKRAPRPKRLRSSSAILQTKATRWDRRQSCHLCGALLRFSLPQSHRHFKNTTRQNNPTIHFLINIGDRMTLLNGR